MEPQPRVTPLFRWSGAYWGFILGARVYEFPKLINGEYAPEEPLYQPTDGLGILRDPTRTVLRRASEPAILMRDAKDRILREPAVTVAKASMDSSAPSTSRASKPR